MSRVLTFSDIIKEVETRIDNTSIQASIKKWVNEAYKDMANSVDSPLQKISDTFTTTAGTNLYDLRPDLKKLTHLTRSNVKLSVRDPEYVTELVDTEARSGSTERAALVGYNTSPASYATGTVSTTINSRTLTGAGTSWLANVKPGDLITIGTNRYNVLAIGSDTSITMSQKALVTEAGSAYTITHEYVPQLILEPNPSAATVHNYRGFRFVYDMVNDNDIPEIPEAFIEGIVWGAIVIGHMYDEESQLGTQATQGYLLKKNEYKKWVADFRTSNTPLGAQPLGYRPEDEI